MSRFALISDLHSNAEAVAAVFARIDELGVREVMCLGDIVGYGADPLPVTLLVMQRCKWTILGNHDWGLFHELDDFNPLAREALFYTRNQLRPSFWRPRRRAAWEFLRTLPERKEDHGFSFCHGSPRDPVMEYVLKSDGFLEPDKMASLFSLLDRPCFVGHTHWPGVHGPDFRFTQATDEQRVFRLRGPCIVNVGSVGQPRDGDPRASFAVVDGDQVEIHRVPYDFRRTQAKILAAGLHPALAERLARGK
ncbi:MAG: metallophosphatase family protein [Planctomycetes bacterium]|nr:metallophosphatase family protein [Planctomycetota bacterium]MCC7397270.1 metallophosphoesterase family protein [Planctomycetota bacterium]